MKNHLLRNVAIYFFILLIIGLFIRDISGQPGLFSSIVDLMNAGSLGDPRTFAKTANEIYLNGGWFNEGNRWVIHLWPPGFILLQASVLKLFGGETAPILLVLIVLSSLAFAFALALIRDYLARLVDSKLAWIFTSALLIFPMVRLFMLEPMGITLGETFSISFFLIALVLILRAIDKKLLSNAIYAGIFFGLSAYFRSQFELLVLTFSIFAIPLIGWLGLTWYKQKDKNQAFGQLFTIKAILAMLIAAHLLMLPWRIYHWVEIRRFSWVQTSGYIALNSLASTDVLMKHNAYFVIAGAGNLACRLEPTNCDKTDTSLFYKTFFQHTWQWYKIRIPVIFHDWFAKLPEFEYTDHVAISFDLFYNFVFLLTSIGIIPLLIMLRALPIFPVLIWINCSFYSAFVMIFTFAQLEARYFYLVKIYGFIMFVILFCLYLCCNATKKLRNNLKFN